ncbi:MAG: maltose alpha-D-glucosyltransferase [Anaerolineales bacterium]
MANSLWYKDAVFYQIYIRAFADGNGDGHGDLIGLTQKLDYLSDLGVDCLWIMPMYPSPLKDDGYDIANYYGIHPDYGTLDDFKRFLDTAHQRGLRVVTDLVLNHTSDQHPWFQSARSSKDSPHRDYYVWSDIDQKYTDARIIFLDVEKSNWTWDEQAGQYFWHRFYASQPDLNFESLAVRAEMINVLRFWLDMGVDGFRADAVPYLIERDGTNCENLPETHAYLKELRRVMERDYPGRILLCEANQWPEEVRPYFGDGDEFHMGFHFPVMPRIYMALRRSDATPIINILERTPPLPENCQWCTFLRNHDELTLEMVTEAERQWMWQEYAPEPRMRLNLGIRRRLAPLLDTDRRKIELANSMLFTLPGSPIVYYGDEIGMGDNIWLPDRHGVRTPMQWEAGPNAGFADRDVPAGRLYSTLIDGETFGYQRVNVAAQRAEPRSLWHTLRRMITIRKSHPAFGHGACEFLADSNPAILAFIRAHAGETLLAVHNLSAQAQNIELDLSQWTGARVQSLLPAGTPEGEARSASELPFRTRSPRSGALPEEGAPLPNIGPDPYALMLEPYSYRWLRLGGV